MPAVDSNRISQKRPSLANQEIGREF